MDKPRLRFAPSPTGPIHLGNLRTALFNWLAARSTGGKFILRIEDTDPARSSTAYERMIYDALLFLGLDWDEGPDIEGQFAPYRQSQRIDSYQRTLQRLLDLGYAYPCFCSEQELERKRKATIAKGLPYRYDRTCLKDCAGARKRMEEGVPCSIRFKMPDEDIIVDDLIRGRTLFPRPEHSDLIIRRSDGSFTYNFTCVVDDSAMAITHVLRGEDHLSNTPKQIALFWAMGGTPPDYAHLPLIHSPEGGKLKKRELGEGLDWIWEKGYLRNALFNYLALLGWSHPEGKEVFLKEDILPVFEICRISKSPSKFDMSKLDWLNEQHLRLLDADTLYNTAMEYLSPEDFKALDIELGSAHFKRAMFELTDGYSNLKEVPDKFASFRDGPYRNDLEHSISMLMQDRDRHISLLKAFRDELSTAEIADSDAAVHLMKSAGGRAGCKGKELYHPLRVAITGRSEGFELKRLLPLLGKERILKRIDYLLEKLK